MKTVPMTVQVAGQGEADQVADLPQEVRLALADIAGVARQVCSR